MTTRVGSWTPTGDSAVFDATLDDMEAVLAANVADAARVAALLQTLKDSRPYFESAEQFSRLLMLCFRLMVVVDTVSIKAGRRGASLDRMDVYHRTGSARRWDGGTDPAIGDAR